MKMAPLTATLVLASFTTFALADDADDVRGVFAAYRSAILDGRGDEAARLLSKSTHSYYDEARRLALSGDAQTVKALPLIDQMQVLMLRTRAPRNLLDTATAEQIIAYAVNEGWIGRDSVQNTQAGQVMTQGDDAVVTAVIGGQDMGPAFRFAREGSWRMDLVPTMQATNPALQAAARQSGLSDEQFMIAVMGRVLGREVNETIWSPLATAAR